VCRETILRLLCLERITENCNGEAVCFEQIMYSVLIEKCDVEIKTGHDGLLCRRDQRAFNHDGYIGLTVNVKVKCSRYRPNWPRGWIEV
jgi:hypothetical protein